ncbi:serine/threonine protein kinase [Sandaracinus amylolyticus]|uniref:non-specific serine/threonine protein kinase n=1 Tax=Sandaracinus amylolyticus TaxID=927083 RepID=A0A0F6YJ87_9BACT|nr:serine/threonine-protein kinase [Sandaracinus amylolyticus]AKF07751.1 Serine/threonine protein kinase PrkC, regulator of stationary phase [Sandaracinus amylolyticus]
MSVPSPKDNAVAPEEISAPPARTGKTGETDPLIGKVVSDRFRILSPIARGGMGVVYKAEQAPLGRLVAIKILSLKHDEEKDPEFRKRFFLEAATVAKLTHPNTVTVFDYGQGDGGIYYIAMELVNGRTLKRALTQEGPFAGDRAINIAKQICRSLREAHRLGVIHRDMKPGNVMLVDRDGEDYVKVLDFGLVKEIDGQNPDEDLTQAGVFMGSPKYMSPEQIQGEHVDGRTDIYAIGVMLYEMLTGRVPFNRENQMQILMDHVREPVPPMTVPSGKPPIPPELQAVVFKCLEKKATDRYPDMEALLVALKQGGGDGLHLTASHSREVDLSMSTGGTPISGVHTVGPQSPPAGMPSGALPPAPTSAAPEEKKSNAPMALAIVAVLAAVGGIGAYATGMIGGGATVDTTVLPTPTTGSPPQPEAPPTDALGAVTAPTPQTTTTTPQPAEPVHTLMVSLRSTPPGATVEIAGREYGPTPAQVELVGELATEGRELELVFSRPGFRPTTVTQVVHGTSMEVEARLTLIRRPGGGGGGGGGDESGSGDTRVEGYRDSPY